MAGKTAAVAEERAPRVSDLEAEVLGPKKPGRGKKGDKENAGQLPKGGGKLRLSLLLSLGWLVLIGVFVLLVIYDPTEFQDIRRTVLLFLNPDEEALDDYYEDKIPWIQDWERELDEFEKELDKREQDLDLFEEQLDDRDNALIDKETEVEDILESLRGTGAEGIIPDLGKTAKSIEAMQPANAAMVLSEIDIETAARLCQLIKDKRLGPIYDAMDVEVCAAIWEILGTPLDEEDY